MRHDDIVTCITSLCTEHLKVDITAVRDYGDYIEFDLGESTQCCWRNGFPHVEKGTDTITVYTTTQSQVEVLTRLSGKDDVEDVLKQKKQIKIDAPSQPSHNQVNPFVFSSYVRSVAPVLAWANQVCTSRKGWDVYNIDFSETGKYLQIHSWFLTLGWVPEPLPSTFINANWESDAIKRGDWK